MKELMTSEDRTGSTMSRSASSLSARFANWARLKSPWVTVFNTGGCNACDIEVIACLMPRFDVERFGILAKSSPRHADILIVTGPVTRKQSTRLRRIWEQIPEPKYVIAMGACCSTGGVFHGLYHTMDGVESTIPVDVYVAGCPPRPDEIINAVVKCLGLMKEDLEHGGRAWRLERPQTVPETTKGTGEVST